MITSQQAKQETGGAGKLTEFLQEFRSLMQREPLFGRATEWRAFFRALQNLVEIACRTEKPVEGRWVLRSRRVRLVSEAERQARVKHGINDVGVQAQILEEMCKQLEIDPGDVEPALVRLAERFCEDIRQSPAHLTRSSPAERAALTHFVESFVNPKRKESHEITQ